MEKEVQAAVIEKQKSKKKKKKLPKKVKLIIAIVMAVVVVIGAIGINVGITNYKRSQSKPEIITKATLEKIINVSDLSTFEAVYNGITKVMNKEKPEKVDYYVSYEATVKAGIDMEAVNIEVDNENKIITIEIPQVKINDVDVQMPSLDFILESNKIDEKQILADAYKQCNADVKSETETETAIYELAEENAQNILEALIKPFVSQLDDEYKIEFK